MKRKEEAMKKYIASFLAICMIFVMVPILPAEAAGLEDTERVEILELVENRNEEFQRHGLFLLQFCL